jgi:hypothetical protein
MMEIAAQLQQEKVAAPPILAPLAQDPEREQLPAPGPHPEPVQARQQQAQAPGRAERERRG